MRGVLGGIRGVVVLSGVVHFVSRKKKMEVSWGALLKASRGVLEVVLGHVKAMALVMSASSGAFRQIESFFFQGAPPDEILHIRGLLMPRGEYRESRSSKKTSKRGRGASRKNPGTLEGRQFDW